MCKQSYFISLVFLLSLLQFEEGTTQPSPNHKLKEPIDSLDRFQLRLNKPILKGPNWSLSATRLFIADRPYTIKLYSVTYFPCSSVNSLIRLTASSATVDNGLISLTSPKLLIGSHQLSLPDHTFAPSDPRVGELKLSWIGSAPWFEVGIATHTSIGSFTPTVLFRDRHPGLGLIYRNYGQVIRTQLLTNVKNMSAAQIQVEGQGGHSIFTLRGGALYKRDQDLSLNAPLLNSLWYQRPTHLDAKLVLYTDQVSILSVGYHTRESPTLNATPIHIPHLLAYWFKTINPQRFKRFSLKISSINRLDFFLQPNESSKQSTHSIWLNPMVYSNFGESHLLVVGEITSSDKLHRSLWSGIEHKLTFHKTIKQSLLHSITLTPRWRTKLYRSDNIPQQILNANEGGLLITQGIRYDKYQADFDLWWGHEDNAQSIKQTWAYRLRMTAPYLQLDFHNLPNRLRRAWLVYRFGGQEFATMSHYLQGHISVVYHGFEENVSRVKESFTFTPFHQRASQFNRRLSVYEPDFRATHFTPHLSQVEGSISYRSILLNMGWWGAFESTIKDVDHLAVQSRVTWISDCRCWYVQLSGGCRPIYQQLHTSSELLNYDWIGGLSFGLGQPKRALGFSPSFDL
jgi:hypothetical protein